LLKKICKRTVNCIKIIFCKFVNFIEVEELAQLFPMNI